MSEFIKNCPSCGNIQRYGDKHAENGGEFKVIGYSVDGYDKEKTL